MRSDSFLTYIGCILGKSEERTILAEIKEINNKPDKRERLAFLKHRMVCGIISLVVTVAKCFRNRGVDLEDLVQEGVMGALEAIDQFDGVNYDTKFSTYASFWVKLYIRLAVHNYCRTIRIPRYLSTRLKKSGDDLTKGRKKLLKEAKKIANVADDEEFKFHIDDKLKEPLEKILKEEEREFINNLDKVTFLNYREKKILKMHYGLEGVEPSSLKSAGEFFGITR